MKINRIPFVSLAVLAGVLAACTKDDVIKDNTTTNNIANKQDWEPIVDLSEHGEVIKLNDPNTDPALNKVSSFEITTPVVSMYINSGTKQTEEKYLNIKYAPLSANLGNVTWKSSDTKIATVNKEGKVKSLKEGVATITATTEDGLVSSCRVIVNDSNITKKEANSAINNILSNQKDPNFRYKQKALIREDYKYEKLVDGIAEESTNFEEYLWVSVEDAYFRIYEYELEMKTAGGSPEPYEADYVFYTTKDYDTYCMKTGQISKNYLVIDQSSLVGKNTKFEALCFVLDNFFTAGSGIIMDSLDEVLGEGNFNSFSQYSTYVKNYGSLSTDNTQFAYQLVQEFDDYLDQEDEENMGIPAGTDVHFKVDIRYMWENSVATTKSIIQTETVSYNGKNYEFNYVVNYFYEIDNVELEKPDLSGYSSVDSLYDL